MISITVEELKSKDSNTLDSMLRDEVVHVKDEEKFKYVIMTEDNYKNLVSANYENETLYSFSQYNKGKIKKGTSADLFQDLGI